jgi:hypothetical protein
MLTKHKVLLSEETNEGPSIAIHVLDFSTLTIHFFGMVVGDEVEIQASNEERPTDWEKVGDTITEDQIVSVDPGARWMRVNLTDGSGGGAISAVLQGSSAP